MTAGTEENKQATPCGTWPSPITAEGIVADGIKIFQPQPDGDDACWLEVRPAEKGRTVLVRLSADGRREDLTPPPYSARSRVHEYGGGAFLVRDGTAWFVENTDQAIYVIEPGGQPRRLTRDEAHRHADLTRDTRRHRLVCVCEDHGVEGEPANFIAAVDDDGRKTILVEGSDFYAAPRISPEGSMMCWLSWSHPRLPWDGTELWVARLDEAGRLVDARRIAGGPEESLCLPAWGPDGGLYFVTDANGWWNLAAWDGKGVAPVTHLEAEVGMPQWVFGQSTYGFPEPDRLVIAATSRGRWQLYEMGLPGGEPRPRDFPWDAIDHVAAGGGRTLVLAGGPGTAPALFRLGPPAHEVIARTSNIEVPEGYLSVPTAVSFPTGEGETAHGLYYPPVNAEHAPASGEAPPLIVKCHGGPTGATSTALDLKTQYWTSRGWGVLDVDYRGSTGYGRDYRRSLYGRWGVADVEDCIAGARYLSERGAADPARWFISGGSAGGYTVLCALAFADAFAGGASHYGIGDLESMFATTHKFEARYDYWLLGATSRDNGVFRERSPLRHAERISCPVIFFQGGKDRVVPPEQSRTMAEALRARGLPVACLEFPDEAHGFRQAEAIRRSIEAEEYFFRRVLGLPVPQSLEPVHIDNADALP